MSDSTLLHKGWHAWIGKRVCVNQRDTGTLKYFGEIKSQIGFWCGVEFDEPIGKTDGVINKVRYFKCKANHGIFVPMHEVTRIKTRSIELNRLSDLSKFKSDCFSDNKKIQTKRYYNKLDKTFDKNENKNVQNNSDATNSKTEKEHTDFVVDERHVSGFKRSKGYSRLGTEESLGILSNLLDEDESWNLLDHSNSAIEKSLIQKISDEIEDDSVFSPSAKALLPTSNKPHIYGKLIDNPKQNYLNIKLTSTPKHCLNNILDLGATVKLDCDQLCDSLHDEIEPIIAGSSGPKLMDFDLTKFKHQEILCSTSKLPIPLFPNELSLLEDVPCVENEEFVQIDKNKKDHVFKAKGINNLADTASAIPVGCLNKNQFSDAQRMPGSLDILNTTYEINHEISKTSTECVKDFSQHLGFESNAFNSDKMSSGVINLNSTFVLPNDSTAKELQADKTFVIDHSPVKPIECPLSTESEINFEKKSLSIILEKTSNENLSNIDGAEGIDGAHSTNISSPKPDSNKTLLNSTHSSKSIDKLLNSFNSSLKIADKKQITSDLNSTFCISSDESKRNKSAASQGANKRHSLSAISEKKNAPVPKEKSNIVLQKSIKQPQLFNTQKTIFKTHNSQASSTSTIKSSKVTTFVNKKVEVEDKNSSSCKLASKDNLKTKYSSSVSNVTEQFKKSLNSCKALYKQTKQEEDTTHVALKITENNTKITARRKSIGGVETKVVSKISYTSNKISISEHSNVNHKPITRRESYGLNSKNLADTKRNSIKRRHTMLPIVLSNGAQAKLSLAKSKSDLSNSKSTVAKSTNTFSDNKCIQPSKTRQGGCGDKKENSRESIIKEPDSHERILENNSKDLNKISANKQNENSTIPKRELLKPGMLSRLPVPGKSIKKPGFISNSAEPQQIIKNINQVDKQRIYKRLPLQKLQDQFS